MRAIATAIILMGIMIADGLYVVKLGKNYPGSDLLAKFFCFIFGFFILVVIVGV